MAKAQQKTETKIVVTGVTLELSEAEANAIYTLLYRGVGQTVLDGLGLRDVASALRSVGSHADYSSAFTRTAQLRTEEDAF